MVSAEYEISEEVLKILTQFVGGTTSEIKVIQLLRIGACFAVFRLLVMV